MPLSVFRKLSVGEAKATTVTLQLADRSLTYPRGIIEDVLVQVEKFIFPADFLILGMEEDKDIPLILGRPFLPIGRSLIDVQHGQLILRLGEEQISFNVFKAMKLPTKIDCCFQIDTIDKVIQDSFLLHNPSDAYEACIVHSQSMQSDSMEMKTCARFLDTNLPYTRKRHFEELGVGPTKPLPSIQQPSKLELKQLPPHLKYTYLGKSCTLPVIISNTISEVEEEKLLRVLRENKTAIRWTIADIKKISPSLCMHKILMEENFRPTIESQRKLNLNMKKVVRAKVLKLLDAGIIYQISDSAWTSPVLMVPKKGGITVVPNEKNKLIPTRTVIGWRVCIDYRKLKATTRKYHFPFPFIDQMLERLASHSHYCFLNGYSGYNQIPVAPDDQEKTTFTCPYGTFTYCRMPFGLYNALATFQRCMMAIFLDMVEKFIEIFIDDFSIFGSSFDECLEHLNMVFQRCKEINLVLN
ncbi:uncharacterized protein LOC111404494 [Olea europaea var. sylvestris]|uniref:uncharacterized protein LOC111404494 n=1 Tax=Olea europaea var. sylvestris TaxID=158386 RepID=UPI000C1D6D18|nr:uncharacterized protein LOC111404494 [Olea europaea var. sylvestris]